MRTPVEWAIVVLNRGWGASTLVPAARRRARAGEGATMLVYVVGERRRPRRVWLWIARRSLRRAVGDGGPALSTSLTVARSVVDGLGMVASGTGGAVMIRLGDARRDAQLRERHIPRLAVDPFEPAAPPAPDNVVPLAPRAADEPRRLLVPYDGSAPAHAALERAAELARHGDEVSVVNVMPEPGVSSRIGPYVEERRRQAALLEQAERFLARRGIRAQRVAAVGNATTETLAAARRLGADVIVVAHQGRLLGGVGSPSDRIARRAPCDVLVVHDAPASRVARRPAGAPR